MLHVSRLFASVVLAVTCSAVPLSTAATHLTADTHRAAAIVGRSWVPNPTTTASNGAVPTVPTIGVLASADYRCTATVVASDSGSLLVTAAHCVYLDGHWQLDNLRFFPGYHDKQSPYGAWDVESAWVSQAWRQGDGQGGETGGSPADDYAFVRLRPNAGGQTAESVLGSEGIRFDMRAGGQQAMIGYPADGRYDGENQRRCTANTATATARDGSLTIGCDFTAGASGSPWLSGGAAGTGTARVGAVLSMTGAHGTNYGIPLDAEAERLYNAADRG